PKSLPVPPRCPLVGLAAGVGVLQHVFAVQLVIEQIEPIARRLLRFGLQRRLQLLNATWRFEDQRPISWSFAACCVGLELGSLSSIGITRLPRSYDPLRHPIGPGLSLAGLRLALHTPGHPM